MSEERTDRCESCKFFRKGEGGPGTRAMTMMMVASGNRWSPSHNDMAAISMANKAGSCFLNPDPIAKWKADWCGQWAAKEGK